MEEIKVGEYVRTKYSGIFKIKDIDFEKFEIIQDNKRVWEFDDLEEMEEFIKGSIVKHSLNIIDLIEKDDYVNGWKVYRVVIIDNTKYVEVEWSDGVSAHVLFIEKDIKSIVTKEQFETMKYEVI